jgi:hypothetical protein
MSDQDNIPPPPSSRASLNDSYIFFNKNDFEKEKDKDDPNEGDINKFFDDILRFQKQNGNMFLFGKITEPILEIIVKIYHENIIRNLKENAQEDVLVSGSHPGFMLGILELDDGNIYLTISEDPEEDDAFYKKIKSLKILLDNSKIKFNIPEEELGKMNINSTEHYGRHGTNAKNIHTRKDYYKKYLLSKMLFTDENRTPKTKTKNPNKINYTSTIFDKELGNENNIFLINSEEYLTGRRNGNGFMPFKKYSKDVKKTYEKTYFECNNGSTCVESKLFSYIYNEGKTFNNIKGFVAYWVAGKGNAGLPPNHFMPKYSYCNNVDVTKYCFEKDPEHLEHLTNIIKDDNAEYYNSIVDIDDSHKHNVLKLIIQPMALSCPGCFLNWNAFKNKRLTKFDYSNCKNKSRKRGNRPMPGGNCNLCKRTSKKNRKSNKKSKK